MNAQQLKNSILQMAIQGKLVPQDPNDEPASVLLSKIQKEKEQLVKEGKLKKKDLVTNPVTDEEKPFDLPDGWEWCRTKSIFNVCSARRVHERDWRAIGIPFYRAREIGKLAEYGFVANDLFIDKSLYDEFSRSGVPHGNDLMVTAVGTLGKVYVVKEDETFYYKDGSVLCLENIGQLNARYFKYVIESPFYKSQYEPESDGTTVATLTMVRVNEYIIPLPPLNEQKRIVAKIEELLPLVEQYSKAQTELDNLNNDLSRRLRQSILQQAIQGKLVPQDPNDEPASVLLSKIQKEKEQLVKEGKLKKKDLITTPVTDEEIPFDIPESWTWCHFVDVVSSMMGKTPPRGEDCYWSHGVHNWVAISDMKDYGHIKCTKEFVSDFAAENTFREKSEAGSLLMSFKLTVGRTCILDIPAYHNEAIITIKPYVDKNFSFRNYLFYLLPLIANMGESKDAIKGRTLNSSSINNLLIPLPPLNEQKRIVAKIEELFAAIKI